MRIYLHINIINYTFIARNNCLRARNFFNYESKRQKTPHPLPNKRRPHKLQTRQQPQRYRPQCR